MVYIFGMRSFKFCLRDVRDPEACPVLAGFRFLWCPLMWLQPLEGGFNGSIKLQNVVG